MIFRNITSKAIQTIKEAGIFDGHWYLEEYGDVLYSGMDAFHHFIIIGIYLGRNPNAKFNLLEYQKTTGIEDPAEALLDFIDKGMPSEFLTERLNEPIFVRGDYDNVCIGYIDSPREGDLLGHDYIEVSGWCYLRGDELKNGSVGIEGTKNRVDLFVGIPRPDVKKVFPHLKHHRVAFEGSVYPELNGHLSTLKVMVESVRGFTHTMTCEIRKSSDLNRTPIRSELRESITHQIFNGSALLS